MTLPDPAAAERLLAEGEQLNPGAWVAHSRYVGEAARAIAMADGALDVSRAYVCGLLHDIGRRVGRTSMRHAIDGYQYLTEMGYDEPARICMTHSFALQNTDAVAGKWDCTPAERAFADRYIADVTYTRYDRLIQLCDALALPTGFVLMEKRLVDVVLRYGTNAFTAEKWQAVFGIKAAFEERIGHSIYEELPGVVRNTFGGQ
jgi:hypothetical protein